MTSSLQKLKQTWLDLGREDPLWAVVSHEDKRGGQWNLEEFLQTGEEQVAHYCHLLEANTKCSRPFHHVLDFGCGVGRLSRAWAGRAERVTGVDISASMIRRAETLVADKPNIRLVLNEQDHLRCFSDGEFDVVFSMVCLQHMPWSMAGRYIQEFARICRAGGVVAFQLPARTIRSTWWPSFRRTVIDSLPFGWGGVYRRWKHGTAAVFEMHYTPRETVQALARAAHLTGVYCESDPSGGPSVESYFYIFEKHTPD